MREVGTIHRPRTGYAKVVINRGGRDVMTVEFTGYNAFKDADEYCKHKSQNSFNFDSVYSR